MCTNCTKCYFLILPLDLIQKALMGKHTVISMVMLYNAICLRQNLLKGFSCKNHLIVGKVLHEINIDKITNVITERRASPNSTIRQKSGHLRDEPGLGRDNLVHVHSITKEYMLGATN